MATTVPMLAPDGTSGDIPQERVQDALKAGFKQAVQMTSPDGKAGYIPAERQQDALKAGFKLAAAPQGSTLQGTAPWQQAIDKAAQTEPYSADKGILGNAKAALNNLGAGAVGLSMGIVAHPLKTLEGMLPTLGTPDGGTQRLTGYTPPPAQKPTWGEAAGQITAALPGLALAKEAAPAASEAVDAGLSKMGTAGEQIRQYMRPTPAPSVVPRTEMAARNLSAAILPATKDATNFIKAAQQEVPNVLDYAKKTGNPLNTQLEFSKAAQGYAQEVRGLYDDKILGPVENKVVKTTGTGFGDRSGEGPDTYSTLGKIDARVVAINKQLEAPALNTGDSRRMLAGTEDLQGEAAGLRDILHRNLSQATGLSPEEIADLRQRVGRSYELANDTNAAVTARMQAVGKGELKDVSFHQLPSKAYNMARGGPVSIADRAFQRAISNFPGESKALPAIQAPAPAAANTLDSLLKSAKQSRLDNLLSLDNLLRIQRMGQ